MHVLCGHAFNGACVLWFESVSVCCFGFVLDCHTAMLPHFGLSIAHNDMSMWVANLLNSKRYWVDVMRPVGVITGGSCGKPRLIHPTNTWQLSTYHANIVNIINLVLMSVLFSRPLDCCVSVSQHGENNVIRWFTTSRMWALFWYVWANCPSIKSIHLCMHVFVFWLHVWLYVILSITCVARVFVIYLGINSQNACDSWLVWVCNSSSLLGNQIGEIIIHTR